ncbi:MAG: M16 family metallopeptidase [Alphaproteobacteria bacterium]
MKIRLTALLFLGLTWLPVSAHAVDIKEVISPGGIKAWLVEEPSIPLIALEFEFDGGASADPAGKEGLAYLTSGLLNEGAGDLDALAFQKQLEERAIQMGFDAGRDYFTGSLKTLSEERDEAFRLLGLALSEPRFDADAVERVREQVLSIQRRESDRPRTVASRAWMSHAFEGHPYARNRKGDEASVTALTRDDLIAYLQANLAKDTLRVGVVGDITPEELGPLLDVAFGALPTEAAPLALTETEIGDVNRIEVVDKAVPQSVAIFGLPGIRRDDPDWFAALVMNQILGQGGFSSRLMEEVRRKRGLTYGVYTYLLPMQHAGVILGSVATVNDRMAESKQVIEAEFARMAADGVTQKELDDAKTYLTGSYALTFDTSDAIAGQLVGIQRYGLGRDYIDNRNSMIEKITLDDVNRVAADLLGQEELFWVIVGQPVGLDTPVAETQP